MHRFYLPPAECREAILTLSESDSHHAQDVLRVRPGERVSILDGAGNEYHCKVETLDRKGVRLVVLHKNFMSPLPYQLTLLQAIPRNKAMELIVQKATELGVTGIVPLLSERTVVQFDEARAVAKSGKWQTVAIEALKQCGAPWLPRVEAAQSPKDFLGRQELFDLPLVASLQPDSRHPREYFQAYQAEHGRLPRRVCVWVGPEGDFTPAEIGAIKSGGALPVTLGRLILRSETAAIYCLAVLNYELQSPLR
jgi:16S rRNA (uracil1498-N3)-methyltransferase